MKACCYFSLPRHDPLPLRLPSFPATTAIMVQVDAIMDNLQQPDPPFAETRQHEPGKSEVRLYAEHREIETCGLGAMPWGTSLHPASVGSSPFLGFFATYVIAGTAVLRFRSGFKNACLGGAYHNVEPVTRHVYQSYRCAFRRTGLPGVVYQVYDI